MVEFLNRHGMQLMGWFFLLVGGAVVLVSVIGLVYATARGMREAATEFAIAVVLFGATPWLGIKMLRESRRSN
jgi:hypothetical protein